MKSIDVKSLIIGLLIGVCVMLVIGQIREPVGRWQLMDGDDIATRFDTSTGALYDTYKGRKRKVEHTYWPPLRPDRENVTTMD